MDIIKQVKELGNPKSTKKTKESPAHMDICEYVRPILENGDEVSLPLLARLIKFKILWLKQQDQQRIADEKKVSTLNIYCTNHYHSYSICFSHAALYLA